MASSALEQRLTKPAQYLRDHRLRITAWIAAGEGVVVAFGLVSGFKYVVYVLAVLGIAFWFTTARKYQSTAARQLSWIFAFSQTLAVLVPIALVLFKWAAFTAVAILAVVALIFLFAERKHL